jgi:hypothetical protein
MQDKSEIYREELKELDLKLRDPAIFSDKNYPKMAKRRSELETIVSLYDTKAKKWPTVNYPSWQPKTK